MKAPFDVAHIGQRIVPRENRVLVQGKGTYVGDFRLNGLLSVAFVRSPSARARIVSIDVTEARSCEGVVAVFTADDLLGKIAPLRLMQENVPPGILRHPSIQVDSRPCNVPVLARDEVSHVGQGIAAIVAVDRASAEDAAELVRVDLEELVPILSADDALAPDAPRVDPTNADNLAARIQATFGDVEGAFADAARHLTVRVKSGRVSASPMETRSVLAQATKGVEGVTVWSSTQVPYLVRNAIAQHLGLREEDVRVIAPDVGGGFGAKVHVYPEEILLAFIARSLEQPVRWIEDRQEHFIATAHGRDQDHLIQVAFEDDGQIRGIRDHFVQDCGIGFPYPMSSAYNVVSHLQGLLEVPSMEIDGTCVLTNKVVNVPYRGSGRPESAFTRDRMLSRMARDLGVGFLDVLRRNMLTVEQMPYSTGVLYRDGEQIVYDGCDMKSALERLQAMVAEASVAAGQPALDGLGRQCLKGIGFGTYTEGTGVGPFEGAVVSVDEAGRLTVEAGGASQGQSHATTFAQIVADEFQVDPSEVLVRSGDTGFLRYGVGTFASRTTIVAGSAVVQAARKLRERVLNVAAEMMEIDQSDLLVQAGRVSARGAPSRSLSLRDIFVATIPGPRAVSAGQDLPGLREVSYFVPPTVTWSYGVVAAAVTVDADTGMVAVDKFWIVHDCGRLINPLVVEGQVDGALIQGLGAALLESILYDSNGTPLTTSFMDYLLPTAVESPELRHDHLETPSERNPLGVKGIGESGIIAAPSAVANAIEAALGELMTDPSPLDVLPIRPESVLASMGKDVSRRDSARS